MINLICQECGTILLKQAQNSGKKQFAVSTWHIGKCDVCGETKPVTEARDFGYPKTKTA